MKSKAALFADFPLDEEIVLGGETLTTPYHIYDGTLLFFGGRVEADAAAKLLAAEGLVPLVDDGGSALAAIWVADFTDANLGPHHELQISLFATLPPQQRFPSKPFAIFRALANRPETNMVCHGLWNNTERVVRYNCEHLRLDAKLMKSRIQRSGNRLAFEFADAQGAMLVHGTARIERRQSPGPLLSMLRQIGWAGLLRSMRADYLHVSVVNTRSAFASEPMVAQTYSRPSRQVLRYFGGDDRLVINHPRYAALNFKPDFVQQNEGVGFVYLRPERLGGAFPRPQC